MKTKLTGISFRNLQIKIPVGTELIIKPDPLGKATGQVHTDPNALSLWYEERKDGNRSEDWNVDHFIGYIPKNLNQNVFKSVTVTQVWYKENQEGQQPVGSEYIEGAYVAGIEVECEGDFQITKPEGRTYEHKGKEFTSMTSFLKKYPSDPEHLIAWALKNFDSPENYKTGLNLLADKGTDMHNKIEEFLIYCRPLGITSFANYTGGGMTELHIDEWHALPTNIQNFFTSLGDFEVISVEDRCYDENLAIAGTCDAILKIKGMLIAFDWKSSKSVQQKHKVQVGGYADFMKCDLGAVVCFGAKNKQGYSVSKVCPKSARNCLTLLGELLTMEKTLTYKR